MKRSVVSRMIYKKLAKMLSSSFPVNAVRVRALRAAGYRIGRSVYVGEELYVVDDLHRDACSLHVGDRVAIAQRVLIVLASYPNCSKLRERMGSILGSVTIGDDAWIGAGAIILPNVRIGESSVVAAGSIVTRDVPPRTVVGGNPARVLRMLEEEQGGPA